MLKNGINFNYYFHFIKCKFAKNKQDLYIYYTENYDIYNFHLKKSF